jgi:hypothetical protein
MTVVKSTFAVSSNHIGNSMMWKQRFLPTHEETEDDEMETSTGLVNAIAEETDGGHEARGEVDPNLGFDPLAIACGKAARVGLNTTFTSYAASEGKYVRELSHFSLHGVWAGGSSYDREVGGLTVSEVEAIFDEELGDLQEFSPWMDIHAGIYDNDIDSYVERFGQYGYPFLALQWPSSDGERSFYSLISHANNTQEVFEVVSATAPSSASLSLRKFPMARHVFLKDELEWLQHKSVGPVQLHVSRTHRNLEAVKAHYRNMFGLEPAHELHDAATGVGFVSFWHQVGVEFKERVRVQVIYWSRPDQSATKVHTTAWLESRLEQINADFMRSYTSCWPVWGDNHYTLSQVDASYFEAVRRSYDEAGMGYMLFDDGSGYIFASYFPLPGGFYVELHPSLKTVLSPEGTAPWDDTYCYSFTCR